MRSVRVFALAARRLPWGASAGCLLLAALAASLLRPTSAAAQATPECGIVDAIDYPIDISDTLSRNYDDFARYRQRFGGLHVGLDIGFDRLGEPVYAAADGQVTYADPEGWDTEKGVVIIRHTFPDNSIAYTLYGHMEETPALRFPAVGECVERGEAVGVIGWPSRGRPHLHYEIRSFMPDDGGPGYILSNPLLEGWYHPLEFTRLWRLRLSPGFLGSATFDRALDLPPVLLDSGLVVGAARNTVEALFPPESPFWQLTMDSALTGLAGLPGDRVIAYTENGRVTALQGGRYRAQWTVDGPDAPFIPLGETLLFLTDSGLAAYDPAGSLIWSISDGAETEVDPASFVGNGKEVALGYRQRGAYLWRLIDTAGRIQYEAQFAQPPLAVPRDDGVWFLLNGASVERITGGQRQALGSTGQVAGRNARMTVDLVGNVYVYLDDAENTLLSLAPTGELRWRIAYPYANPSQPPLLDTGAGCLLYTLDADGMLNIFSTADGALVHQVQLYAGGEQTSRPGARLLQVDTAERILASSGFLSVVALDGAALAPHIYAGCLLG